MKALFAIIVCANVALGEPALSSKLEETEKLQKFLGLTSSHVSLDNPVKVAVLSAGFAGMEDNLEERLFPRTYLPEGTRLIGDYGDSGMELRPNDASGRRLAQLVWGLLGYSDKIDFRLYNGHGLSNQRKAVEHMMGWEPDIVLSTEVFPTFGNFDGTGPLNRYIRALSQMGTIWIQSAGTVGGRVYNGKVHWGKGYYQKHPLTIDTDDTELSITLSWNAFSPGRNFYGTELDLDLVVRDSSGREVGRSALKQVTGTPEDGQTNLASEKVELNLFRDSRPYQVCVEREGGDFGKDHCYRLTVESEKQPYFDEEQKKEIDPIRLVKTSFPGELGVPADNPFVITVGSEHPWSATGPTWDGRAKPDLVFDGAEVNFTDKNALVGPQAAVGYMGALAISLKSNIPDMKEKHLRKFIDWGRRAKIESGSKKRREVSARWKMPSLQKMKDLVRENP